MTKRKLQRFAEIETFPNVIQPPLIFPPVDHEVKGNWKKFFGNKNPVTLELGCGRGEYTIHLAEKFPEQNFTGIDIKGARLWRGGKTASEREMKNVGFLRIPIETIEYYFAKDEVSEIWITFPDPQPQLSRERKRLTSPLFLECYKKILKPGGIIHLKTDNKPFYDYTCETIVNCGFQILASTDDVYHSPILNDVLEIKTTYEIIWLRKQMKICYVKFQLAN